MAVTFAFSLSLTISPTCHDIHNTSESGLTVTSANFQQQGYIPSLLQVLLWSKFHEGEMVSDHSWMESFPRQRVI